MQPLVGIIMGSTSDWETMKHACDILDELNVPYEKKVVSAHRTPDFMFEYAETARERGIKVIIAGLRRSGASGDDGCENNTASHWSSGSVQGAERNGFTSFHRPNAWRRACCDNIYRQSGCCERRPVSGANFVSI